MVGCLTFAILQRAADINRLSILEGPKAALIASKDFEGGHYTSPPYHGIRAFGRVALPWAFSQTVRKRTTVGEETHSELSSGSENTPI